MHRHVNRCWSEAGSARAVVLIACLLIVLTGLFVTGYLPQKRREEGIVAASNQEKITLPVVSVVTVQRSAAKAQVELPGNVQALGETPVYARAEGYIVKRYVDIGDHVKAGQVLVEIDAPELDQQRKQAQARVAQTRAALTQAQAAQRQAAANLKLAETTLGRWRDLVNQGILSKQEGDEKQATSDARRADLESAHANINAATENIHAAEADLQRLMQLQSFEKVTAPFAGIITARNCAVGNLITPAALSTGRDLFRLADISRLRVFVSVPEVFVPAIKVGQTAELTLQEYPGRKFTGSIFRTANSLDTGTRTLLTEVQVVNPDGALMPGMFAQVTMANSRQNPPLMVPGDTLLTRSDGQHVAVVGQGNTVHLKKVQVGRDNGSEVEILSGLNGDERLVVNPTDEIRESAKVEIRTK
jgi:membrane fusion protein (multidrug efflux system)